VRVGYVVGAPLWKATYRLSLPGDAQADKARLQGWAVLENFSGQPWREVELTLISGNLVTFRQALYESYYVNRPNVPVEVEGRVLPQPDTGSIAVAQLRRNAKSVPPVGGLAAQAPASMAMDEAAQAPPPAFVDSAEANEEVPPRLLSPCPTRSASQPARACSCRFLIANCRRAASISTKLQPQRITRSPRSS
jgi:hypothetical protein